MASNGGDSGAHGERIRAKYAQRGHMLQRSINELPPYRDEMDSEVTINRQGIAAKLGLPRPARLAIGVALAIAIAAFAVAAAVIAVLRLT